MLGTPGGKKKKHSLCSHLWKKEESILEISGTVMSPQCFSTAVAGTDIGSQEPVARLKVVYI